MPENVAQYRVNWYVDVGGSATAAVRQVRTCDVVLNGIYEQLTTAGLANHA